MKKLIDQLKEQNAAKAEVRRHPEGELLAGTLEQELDRFLVEKNAKENPGGFKKISGFHPSYGYKCKRRWVLLFMGAKVEEKFSARTVRIFDNGHGIHERWGKYFDNMGILVDNEVPINVSDPVPIVGHADGIIRWSGNKLYELKSMNPSRFEFRRMYRKPDEKTYEQAQLYLWATDLDEGYTIYENKGSQEVLIFPIVKDEKNINKQLKRFTAIYKFVQAGDIPKRPYRRDSQECGDCSLEKYCWDELKD